MLSKGSIEECVFRQISAYYVLYAIGKLHILTSETLLRFRRGSLSV